MIRLPERDLQQDTGTYLQGIQDDIDAFPDFAERVADAKKRWDAKNNTKAGKLHFQHVKDTLTDMCQGARRCAYCEDSLADEIEHVKPKNFYPDTAFSWSNYLYACGPCNGRKSDKFYVVPVDSDDPVLLERKKTPPDGEPVFIDPRAENPLEFLQIDILDTFRMMPQFDLSPADQIRAELTLDILWLEEGTAGHLTKARKQAYRNFKARLKELIELAEDQPGVDQLADEIKIFQEMDHQSVWLEMKRSHAFIPELAQLFDRFPKALDW